MGLQTRTLPAVRNGYEFPPLALQLRNLFGCVFPFSILYITIFMYRHSPTLVIFPAAVYRFTPALRQAHTVSKTSFLLARHLTPNPIRLSLFDQLVVDCSVRHCYATQVCATQVCFGQVWAR